MFFNVRFSGSTFTSRRRSALSLCTTAHWNISFQQKVRSFPTRVSYKFDMRLFSSLFQLFYVLCSFQIRKILTNHFGNASQNGPCNQFLGIFQVETLKTKIVALIV